MKPGNIVRPLLAWFATNARDLPWRRTTDPYAIWVSEIMLQQTQVKTVIPYWEHWMRELPTIHSLARAEPGKLHKLWEGLGYYSRVRNMQRAAQGILEQHAGRFPHEFEKVLELPGIGRYTAGAICSIAFNQPYPVLDGNVIRVLTRRFGIKGNPRESKVNQQLWGLAEDLVRNAVALPPKEPSVKARAGAPPAKQKKPSRAADLNQGLMELGALVCTARQPRCNLCPIAISCVARKEGRIQDYPAHSRRAPTTHRHFMAFVVEKRGRILVRQRSQEVVNAFLWEFPNFELTAANNKNLKAEKRELERLPMLQPLCSIKHTITRFRITLEVFRASLGNATPAPRLENARWLSGARLQELPFTSAHKKILQRLSAIEKLASESVS